MPPVAEPEMGRDEHSLIQHVAVPTQVPSRSKFYFILQILYKESLQVKKINGGGTRIVDIDINIISNNGFHNCYAWTTSASLLNLLVICGLLAIKLDLEKKSKCQNCWCWFKILQTCSSILAQHPLSLSQGIRVHKLMNKFVDFIIFTTFFFFLCGEREFAILMEK